MHVQTVVITLWPSKIRNTACVRPISTKPQIANAVLFALLLGFLWTFCSRMCTCSNKMQAGRLAHAHIKRPPCNQSLLPGLDRCQRPFFILNFSRNNDNSVTTTTIVHSDTYLMNIEMQTSWQCPYNTLEMGKLAIAIIYQKTMSRQDVTICIQLTL